MDFLNKAYRQVADLFLSMTPAARITAGLLLVVIVVSLVLLFRLRNSGDGEYLFGGRDFSQSELGAMETAFAKSGLKDSEIVGFRMRVPRAQKDLYLAALAEGNSLPPGFADFEQQAAEATSPFESRQQQEKRWKLSVQNKIASVIAANPEIESATVQLDEQRSGGLHGKVEKTALVAVKPLGNRHIDDELARNIRNAMSGAVAGLDRGSVTVYDMNAGKTWTAVGEDGRANASESAYASHKAMYERMWREKIVTTLAYLPGVIVGVNVDLDPKLDSQQNSRKYDPQPVAVSTSESDENSTSTDKGPAGRPGAASNGVSNSSAVVQAQPASQNEFTRTTAQQHSLASTTELKTTEAGLTPTKVGAVINIPSSYFAKVWREQHPTPDGEEPATPDAAELSKIEIETTKKIEEQVARLLPSLPAGEDQYPQVVVKTYQDLPAPAMEEPSTTNKALLWFAAHWQTVGMTLVGLVSLIVLRGMVRSAATRTPQIEPARSIAMPEVPDETETEESAPAPVLKRRFRSTGPTLRDELTSMVKEDPDTAANVLRNWIGDAA